MSKFTREGDTVARGGGEGGGRGRRVRGERRELERVLVSSSKGSRRPLYSQHTLPGGPSQLAGKVTVTRPPGHTLRHEMLSEVFLFTGLLVTHVFNPLA
jgi:hypothetical protein